MSLSLINLKVTTILKRYIAMDNPAAGKGWIEKLRKGATYLI